LLDFAESSSGALGDELQDLRSFRSGVVVDVEHCFEFGTQKLEVSNQFRVGAWRGLQVNPLGW